MRSFLATFIFFILTSLASASACSGKIGIARTIDITNISKDGVPLNTDMLGLTDGEFILTFDDGPNKWTTPPVLSTLADECVQATFFALGTSMVKYPSLIFDMLTAGHTIGTHSYDHKNLSLLPEIEASENIDLAIKAFIKASRKDQRPVLFRFPFLAFNSTLFNIIRKNKLIAIDADISGNDWSGNSCRESSIKVKKEMLRRRKGIILMHDVMADTDCELRSVLEFIKESRFSVVHLRALHDFNPN